MSAATDTSLDVVGVEVTIDGFLVIADRLGYSEFPITLAIHLNIAETELREKVWAKVSDDLKEQGVLLPNGQPHPTVAMLFEVLVRADRTLEGRWYRRDRDGKLVRFTVSRWGKRQMVTVRDNEMLILQLVAESASMADMVQVVMGEEEPATIDPLTAKAEVLAKSTTADQLVQLGAGLQTARKLAEIGDDPLSWAEIVASQRLPGGSLEKSTAAAGVVDSKHGRIVSIPRTVNSELYGSFLSGTPANLQRALEGLMEYLPAKRWTDPVDDWATGGYHDD